MGAGNITAALEAGGGCTVSAPHDAKGEPLLLGEPLRTRCDTATQCNLLGDSLEVGETEARRD